MKSVALIGLLMANISAFALDESAFSSSPSTNLFTNNPAQQKRFEKKMEESPRQFGIFSPLHTVAPSSFGNGPAAPGVMPFIPRPAPVPDNKKEETDNKRDWIFAKPEDNTPEKIFKVNNFGQNDKQKQLDKSQSGFTKFLSESATTDKSGVPNDNNFGRKEEGRSLAKALQNETRNDTARDFESRNIGRQGDLDNRNNAISTKTSVFGEYFGGNQMAQERWAEQSAARRAEFQQLFETRSTATDANRTVTQVNPTAVSTPTDFSRSTQAGASDAWKNELRPFAGGALDEASRRQNLDGTGASAFGATAAPRQTYAPAVLPFPKRPGELFK